MKGKKKFRLEADIISTDEKLKEVFSNLMQFDKWDSAGINDWIDLISVHNGTDPALARFASDEEELFFIEIHNSNTLKRKHVMKLADKIRRVNQHYMNRFGKPVLALMLL